MRTRVLVGMVLIVLLALGANALDGKGGYTAAEHFRWGDVRDSIEYDAAFHAIRSGAAAKVFMSWPEDG